MKTLEVPPRLAIRVKTVPSGIQVRSGPNLLYLMFTPLSCFTLGLGGTVFGYFLSETWAALVTVALLLFLHSRQESLLLRRDGTLRWTRYWGSSLELDGQQVKATVLKNGRVYLAGDRGLYWPVGAQSLTWLQSTLGSWAEEPDAVEVSLPVPPTMSYGFKPWEVGVFGLAMASFMGIPFFLIVWDGAEPAEADFWHHVGLMTCLAAVGASLLGAALKWLMFRAVGEVRPLKSFFRTGILFNGFSLAIGLVTLGMAAFTYNIYEDPTTEPVAIPIVSSFHITGTGGNNYPQDIHVLEFDFPPYIQREPIACFSPATNLKPGDTVNGVCGKGRLGCRWYRLPESIQNSLVNAGEVYQSGLENQSFGHMSLVNAMTQGKVRASGHFAPHSSSLALLRSYNVPITQDNEPAKTPGKKLP